MSTSVTTASAKSLLADYPHVARCAACRVYAEDLLEANAPLEVLPAVLDHHDSAHMHYPLNYYYSQF